MANKIGGQIQKNNDFIRLTNNQKSPAAISAAFHPSIEFNVLFICRGIGLNERVTFNRNSIFRALACSHLGFNRIIGNDNDIYIGASPLYANSTFAYVG